MEILVCLDKKLIKQLICLLYNLVRTQNSLDSYTIHVIHGKIAQSYIRRIKKFCIKVKLNIKFYHFQLDEEIDFPTWGHGSEGNYYRLFFSEITKICCGKLLYLDLDLLLLEDLFSLYEIDLQGHALGAHAEESVQTGSEEAESSFNSGIMLIDVKQWIINEVPKATVQIIKEKKIPLVWWDNDILNSIFSNNWLDIGKKWNLMPSSFTFKTTQNPGIIHFAGSAKPWHKGYRLSYANAYRKMFLRSRVCYYFSNII